MYLEKLEIQGFKSFANKNTLKFVAAERDRNNRHGVTAIVGPNGSGKSNIADAVRWVLGEQSVKLLRGKKSEDVIFSGSRAKAALSFAEVSLFLNNADRAAPIDFQEVVVTRRLYRDGESEYLLNGSRVRLLDVSLMLAKAHFGQRAYSVIGQGMVENFLNTTLAERKEFFDEATGVKMYQIKRDDATNKLQNACGNLAQAASLLAEIEPRMRSLTRQMKRLEQRTEVEAKLRDLRTNYYAAQWHALSDELKEANNKLLDGERKQREQEKEVTKLNQKITAQRARQTHNEERQKLIAEKKLLEEEKNNLWQRLSEAKAKLNVSYEIAGKIDVAWLLRREETLTRAAAAAKAEIKKLEQEVANLARAAQAAQAEERELNKKGAEARRQLISSGNKDGDAGQDLTLWQNDLEELLLLSQRITAVLEHDLAAAKKYSAQLEKKLTALKEKIKTTAKDAAQDWQSVQKEAAALEEKHRAALEEYLRAQAALQGAKEKLRLRREELSKQEQEVKEIQAKISSVRSDKGGDQEKLETTRGELGAKIKAIEEKVGELENKVITQEQSEEAERIQLNKQEKLLFELQQAIRGTNAPLNEIKVDKARLETKLEDLENEVRMETNNLRAIIDYTGFDNNIDRAAAGEQIKKFKRQLELVGSIDPETKAEYEDTKTRFEFLSNQTADLESGIKSLAKVVVELDKTIAAKFDKAFAEIAAHFEKYFKVLFGGGGAKLVKIMEDLKAAEAKETGAEDETDADEGGEPASVPSDSGLRRGEGKNKIVLRQAKQVMTGIEIEATPPGKKIKSIAMLSGGERALTAIALICAIISVNPSPFVVLDEVDAALDEANSGRLGSILEELAHKTQFIVITHNRSIMYKADIIYGVTMGADGVSQLLSLKIDETKSITN